MASKRGYLDRLVEDVTARRVRAAGTPRELTWGPSRPAALAADDLAGPGETPRPAGPHVPRRPAERAPQSTAWRAETGKTTPQPPGAASLRVVTDRQVREAPGTPPAAPAEAGRHPAAPPRRPPAVPTTPALTGPTERPDASRRPSADAPEPARPPIVAPAHLPATVTDALARLSALSNRVPQAAQPATVRSPATPATPAPVAPARSTPRSTPPATVLTPRAPRPTREQPSRAPQVHIGNIEVTIAAPPPPAAPPALPPLPQQPAPVAAGPAARLSRQVATFGLGQG